MAGRRKPLKGWTGNMPVSYTHLEKTESLSLNRATDTTRQPGSTFKVVAAYAAALDSAGMTLATTQYDAPYNYNGGKGRPVRNWNGENYQGWTSLRKGIEQSMNIVAVKTITRCV